jgi:hemerythrin
VVATPPARPPQERAEALAWDETLATGDETVDRQHQELIRQINALVEAMAQGRGRTVIGRILDYLDRYVGEHFSWEETCMHRHRCPAAEVNRQAHSRFVQNFKALRDRFDREGPSTDLVLQVRRDLGDWLIRHIRGIDTGLRPCLKKSPSGSPVSQARQSRGLGPLTPG